MNVNNTQQSYVDDDDDSLLASPTHAYDHAYFQLIIDMIGRRRKWRDNIIEASSFYVQ